MAFRPVVRRGPLPARASRRQPTEDSFQNFALRLGMGQDNALSQSTYGFNPLSRNRQQLEWMYRGNWLVRMGVDAVADDMTRGGMIVQGDMPPERIDRLQQEIGELCLWEQLSDIIRWSRLYGGALGVLLIDGQDMRTPLRVETVGPKQFKGLAVMDRWMVQPDLVNVVKEYGPDLGMPAYYDIVADAPALPRQRVHWSRVIRFDGPMLPYYGRMSENWWGISVIEPFYDRLVAFDSATAGAAQLTYRSYLRTVKIENLRELIATGGKSLDALTKQLDFIRQYQSNEGITLLDASDSFETTQYSFAGLSDVLTQFAMQMSGALKIPLVRLMGQSPAGLNSTGESDLRTYYDGIETERSSKLRRPVRKIVDVAYRSEFGEALPAGFGFGFAPLWQMSEEQKAAIASQDTASVIGAFDAGVIGRKTALQELRQSSRASGRFASITDEQIAEAEEDPPAPDESVMPGAGEAAPGEAPGGEPGPGPGPGPGAGVNGEHKVDAPGGVRVHVHGEAGHA